MIKDSPAIFAPLKIIVLIKYIKNHVQVLLSKHNAPHTPNPALCREEVNKMTKSLTAVVEFGDSQVILITV